MRHTRRSRVGRWMESAVDYAMALGNPRKAMFRRHWREMAKNDDYRELVLAMVRARGYRAADKSKQNSFWGGSGGSADAHLSGQAAALRERSRELGRDDSVACGLVGTFETNVVGTGIRPQANTGDREKNRRIESVWKSLAGRVFAAEGTDVAQAQRMMVGRLFEDGEFLIKPAKADAESPVWIELLEADRLASPIKAELPEGHTLRDGVQRDAAGRPVVYWIRKRHPGDVLVPSEVKESLEFEQVPAEQLRHVRVVKRPGQTRGVPMMHAILQDLRDLDLLMLAALKRTQIAACLSIFIKSDQDVDEIVDATAEKYGYKIDQPIEPGMMFKLAPGESIETLVPNFPIPELEPFVLMIARRIGAALGVCWQIVLKDFSRSNYSSARTDLLESRPSFTFLQHLLIENALTPIWLWVLGDALLRGDERLRGVTLADLATVRWVPTGWKWVDPQKEALAAKIELSIGTTTLQILCAQKGLDWEEVLEQRALEQQRIQSLGLPNPFTAEKGAKAARELAALLDGDAKPKPKTKVVEWKGVA